jgi:hypothetical protein
MQLTGFVLGAVLAATPLISVTVLAADANTVQQRGADAIRLASACPPGTHWANAGYVGGGKWRDSHCAKNDGSD